ncbi:hypothetical protein, partial [Mycolicibacterium sp. CBMA 360]|uniref:hypothetical protein n=2 Tax=Mycolicibacterium TaxID=1866885 RepID=UPI0013969818
KLLALYVGAVCAPLRLLPRKAGVRQATAPLAPSDTTGEAGVTAPAPASPPRLLTPEQRRIMITAVLPASFTLRYCQSWKQRLAVVDAVREAIGVIEDYEAGGPLPEFGTAQCASSWQAPASRQAYICTRPTGHGGRHGYAGMFWTDAEATR